MCAIWRKRSGNYGAGCGVTVRLARSAPPRCRAQRSSASKQLAQSDPPMTPSARLSAAIEIFAEIEARRRPAADALKDWGLSHRFAGSGDRAAIAGLVYDALRRKSSAAWLMGEASPRATLIGMLRRERGLDTDAIAALCNGGRHAPSSLTNEETAALATGTLADAPAYVEGDYPEWLDPHLKRVFGDERAAEGA